MLNTYFLKSLSKAQDLRPCCDQLLKADFIAKYSNEANDLELVQKIISLI